MDILNTILSAKREEIFRQQAQLPLPDLQAQVRGLQGQPRGFAKALRGAEFPAIIAEIKRASPSRGVIRADLDPVETAQTFARSGATCLSILTDEQFFRGHLSFLSAVRAAAIQLPLLRKDFVIDEYQLWQSRLAGADAVLLIVAALDDATLSRLLQTALQLDLDVLIEVHDEHEAQRVLSLLASNEYIRNRRASLLLGVNNRNLRTFVTDSSVTEQIANYLEKSQENADSVLTLVSESGIGSALDLLRLKRYGAQAFLIGESLVAHGEPGRNLSDLCQSARQNLAEQRKPTE